MDVITHSPFTHRWLAAVLERANQVAQLQVKEKARAKSAGRSNVFFVGMQWRLGGGGGRGFFGAACSSAGDAAHGCPRPQFPRGAAGSFTLLSGPWLHKGFGVTSDGNRTCILDLEWL